MVRHSSLLGEDDKPLAVPEDDKPLTPSLRKIHLWPRSLDLNPLNLLKSAILSESRKRNSYCQLPFPFKLALKQNRASLFKCRNKSPIIFLKIDHSTADVRASVQCWREKFLKQRNLIHTILWKCVNKHNQFFGFNFTALFPIAHGNLSCYKLQNVFS